MKNAVKGLVLAGGYSRRMGRDKALLNYHGMPQARWTGKLLSGFCGEVYYSCREGQDLGDGDDLSVWRIHDKQEGEGPIGGMLSAHQLHPASAWIVVACDLPRLDGATVQYLLDQRDSDRLATAFISSHDCLPEPLCAVYEPRVFGILSERFNAGGRCPRRVLIDLADEVCLLKPVNPRALDNANTPGEAGEFDLRK